MLASPPSDLLLGGGASASEYRAGMRHLPSAVCLATGGTLEHPVGLIVTSVCSVSLEPPTLLVCISQSASAHNMIVETGLIGVNVLSSRHTTLVDQFSRSERRHERFTSEAWVAAACGVPLLADAICSFECSVVDRIPYSTHSVLLCVPEVVTIGSTKELPAIYLNGAIVRPWA